MSGHTAISRADPWSSCGNLVWQADLCLFRGQPLRPGRRDPDRILRNSASRIADL